MVLTLLITRPATAKHIDKNTNNKKKPLHKLVSTQNQHKLSLKKRQ